MRWVACAGVVACAILVSPMECAADEAPLVEVGVAKVDITPEFPVRLSGYGFRRAEHEGVIHPIWAKALAIGDVAAGPAVLLMVDATCIPEALTDEVARRLSEKAKVPRDKFALCFTHTHTAPMVAGALATLFGEPVPPEHQKHIEQYTAELTDKLEQVSLAALADRRPGRLSWAVGTAKFAANRRTPGGPVDHSLPVMFVHGADGALRAVVANYACHCTTLDDNLISGDWAGYSQLHIERAHPGAIAMITIGCGADSNPEPRRSHELADQHGRSIATEVERLLGAEHTPIDAKITARSERIQLPFDAHPTRAEWEERAKQTDAVGYHARVQLARLDAGQELRKELGYTIQSWTFGDDLEMLFLSGEVVVDYELRLKKEFDASRLWVNAYSNDAPCYIPSRRIWEEGGYEGASAMTYYDQPTRLTADCEELIMAAAHRLAPEEFRADKQAEATRQLPRLGATGGLPASAGVEPVGKPLTALADEPPVAPGDPEFPPALSPEDSLRAIQLKPGFKAELVAYEPLVVDPVAIDFGADGKLWVVEMHDYPAGLDGNWKPGGRLKNLIDNDADGRYDEAVTLADDLPFPTGVMAWRKGALVCAAPDVLYLEDTDGDGRADVRRVVLTGFVTENYQARVNSLTYGLDDWVYGANGLLGGTIRSGDREPVELGARDFRFRPDTGEIEPVSGLSQQGRIRDDWGNYFGCDNSTLLRHYPLEERYLRRNPYVAAPEASVYVPRHEESNRVFPVSRTLERFNDPEHAGRVTSGCGPCIYRDELLGDEYYGNAFICEPVHNLVTRLVLTPEGVTFAGRRANDEQQREFLASTDNWFRPVQATTGPDGALWVVDMYRFVIEHPRWITPERLAKLDVRAGSDKGRIYRIFREDRPPRKVSPISQLDTPGLVAELSSPNGPRRDLAQRALIVLDDPKALQLVSERIVLNPKASDLARVHAMWVLAACGSHAQEFAERHLADADPRVRRHALRLLEVIDSKQSRALQASSYATKLNLMAYDPDPQVRLQLALTLGEFASAETSSGLWVLLAREEDAWIRAAAWSSMKRENLVPLMDSLFSLRRMNEYSEPAMERLMYIAAASGYDAAVRSILITTIHTNGEPFDSARWRILAGAMDGLEAHGSSLDKFMEPIAAEDDRLPRTLDDAFEAAATCAADMTMPAPMRLAAIKVIGRRQVDREAALPKLAALLAPSESPAIRQAAVEALARRDDDGAADILLDHLNAFGPEERGRILDAVLARTSWTLRLLDRIESESIAANEIDAGRRARLLEHADEFLRERAAKSFSSVGPSDRQLVIQRYLSVALYDGNSQLGRKVFEAKCASCHAFQGIGQAVGPDLATLTDRSCSALLTALLDPNRAVDARYASYTALTTQGLTHTGILKGESATDVKLLAQEGREYVILRSELEELRSSAKSLMPEGLEQELTPRELADLFAFLGAPPATPKAAPGNTPALVTSAASDRAFHLFAANCEVYGPTLIYMPEDNALGWWNSTDDYSLWSVDVPTAAKYDVTIEWSCDPACAGNRFVLESQSSRMEAVVPSTGSWQNHEQRDIGEIELPAGQQRLLLRAEGPVKEALLDLREVTLTPRPNADGTQPSVE